MSEVVTNELEIVRVVFEVMGDDEIEIDEGPVNGWLFALREELEDEG